MAPGATTRRILWARAAGRCAICRSPLVLAPGQDPPEGAGPRKQGSIVRLSESAGDRYDNLILLCRDHQGMASSSSGAAAPGHAPAHLRGVKARHEEWVRRSELADHPTDSAVRYDPRCQGVTLLPRVDSGRELAGLLEGVHSLQYDREEPGTAGEAKLVEGFLQYIRSITEVWKEYDPEEKNRAASHLEDQIAGLDRGGLLLFALRYSTEAGVAGVSGDWSILRLWILREGPPGAPSGRR